MNITKSIEIDSDIFSPLFGVRDVNIKEIEKLLGVHIATHDSAVVVRGESDSCETAARIIVKLSELISGGEAFGPSEVKRISEMFLSGHESEINALSRDTVALTAKMKPIRCKTPGQSEYVKAIRTNGIVFGIGPAGTGKTYLATALAAKSLKKGEVERIILTRPVVEAGEKLGFLPGDLQEKVDPYLRPLYDALGDMFGTEGYTKLIERGIIEIAPLAYMRGRTLANAFVILDEAQNTTSEQMKMFLTRLGEGSRMVVNGDSTQTDLPKFVTSGLEEAARILDGVEGVAVVKLSESDVIRSDLVRRIVAAYTDHDRNKQREKEKSARESEHARKEKQTREKERNNGTV